MFEASSSREASITLCLFPQLREFIAVDARANLPGGAAVHVLSFDDIFTDEFHSSVESAFSALLRKQGAGLIEMIGLPQEVESLVRAESMKRIIKNLNHAAGVTSINIRGGIGVLFFTRGLLAIEPDQLEAAMKDLFDSVLTGAQLQRLKSELERLIADEKEAEGEVREREISRLIKGDPGSFVTLWQSKDKS